MFGFITIGAFIIVCLLFTISGEKEMKQDGTDICPYCGAKLKIDHNTTTIHWRQKLQTYGHPTSEKCLYVKCEPCDEWLFVKTM